MSIKIAIVDDHPAVITGVKQMLADEADIDVIASYVGSREFLDILMRPVPDVLLLDIHMPERTGEELMPTLKERYPDMRIIAFTAFDHLFYVKSMLQLGALGYILKTSRKQVILEAIHSVYGYKEYIDPELRAGIDKIKRSQQQPVMALTTQERKVLRLLVDGYDHQEIAGQLSLSLNTIKNYRKSLLSKLDVHNGIGLVRKAIELRLV